MTARQRARKQPAEARRETLVDAAIQCFATGSYSSVGTAEIARVAGVAEPTIYRHFSSKRELYLAALTRCGETVRHAFATIASAESNPVLAFGKMGEWYTQRMMNDRAELQMRQRAIAETEDEEIQAKLRDVYDEIVEIVAVVVRRGQSMGLISPEIEARAVAWLFVGMGNIGDLMMLMGVPFEACNQLFNGLSPIFLRGILAKPELAPLFAGSFDRPLPPDQ